jgi:hypothetical protein
MTTAPSRGEGAPARENWLNVLVQLRAAFPWVFAAQIAALDVGLRGPLFHLHHPRWVFASLAGVLVLRLVAASEAKWARALACGLVALFVWIELATYRYFHVPFDLQVAIAARHSWIDVRPVVLHALPLSFVATAILGAAEWMLVRRPAPIARVRLFAVAALGAFALGAPFGEMVTLAFGRSEKASQRAVLPALQSVRARPPNVLLLLTESVRASDFGEDLAPEIHDVLRSGVRFSEMRSVASYTALSLSALLTGLLQTGSRSDVLVAPDLFDFAGSIGSAHYWSAHSETVFERKDVGRALTSFVTADTMLGHPIGDVEEAVAGGLDRRLADDCRNRFPGLTGPYFTMAHFSGTHAPYFFDEANASHKPFSHVATWSSLEALHRAYENAITEQDHSLAACARAFIAAQNGAPWIIILTSDHGEAFGEHSGIHHGHNLYDEQVHVPAIVAFGNGALSQDEEQTMRANASAFATHLDLAPTVLDAIGIRDHFAIARHVGRMPGRSLLRTMSATPPVPITNCSEMFPCPLSAWGVLAGDRKLFAQPWDGRWRCLRLDGGEHEVGPDECSDLAVVSRATFPTLPNGEPNR